MVANVILDDQGALDGINDAMNEGAGTVLYAIGTPILIAALAAGFILMFLQAVHTMMESRDGRWATVAAWFVAAGAAFLTVGVIAGRWDDPQLGEPLYGYQQKLKWVAAAAGAAAGFWITLTFLRSNRRGY